jgi:CO dehydrogenase maturation factor
MCETCGGHGPSADRSPETTTGGNRIVVVGKGGVGKSTISALLARALARRGLSVLAVDADEQRNLAATLGVDAAVAASLVPLAEDAGYIEEKTGARPGEGAGGMLRLNPDTSDLVDRLSVPAPDGVRLVVMGGVRRAGGGCLCPETALVASAVGGMHLHAEDFVVMDTHAGVEHFGRALARGFDTAVVVVEPSFNAVQVGVESAGLARDLGISRLLLVVNRASSYHDVERVLGHIDHLGGFDFESATILPVDQSVIDGEPSVDVALRGSPILDALGGLVAAVMEHAPAMSGPVA